MLRRPGCCIVVLLVAAVFVGAVCGSTAGAGRSRPGALSSSITGEICSALDAPVATAASRLFQRFAKSRTDPSVAIDLVLKIGFTQCKVGVTKLVAVTRSYLHIPKVPVAPAASSFNLLDSLQASTIATQLNLYRPAALPRYGAREVSEFVDALCTDARRGFNPSLTYLLAAPSPTIAALTPLNASVRLADKRCGLAPWQTGFLTSGAVGYVLSKVGRADVDPPVAVMFEPRFAGKDADGKWQTTLTWLGFDGRGTVARFDVWMRAGRVWSRLPVANGTSSFLLVDPGLDVQFAVRALDAAGNYGAYSYTKSYRT